MPSSAQRLVSQISGQRLSSAQSKSTIYLRLTFNIKTHIRRGFKASQAWFSPQVSRPQAPGRHYQPASLRT
jgi:hypothetical protein